MRLHTLESAVQLFPCEGDQLCNACRDYEALTPLHFNGVESLHRLTLEGYFTAEQICFNGVPSFVMWWAMTIEGSLCVHALQSLNVGTPLDVAFIAADLIKQRQGCNSIVIAITRQGMAAKAKKFGFQFQGLMMRKA